MSAIDLSTLPAPNVVEPLDFETIFASMKAELISLWPQDQRAEIEATLELESEPITKQLQASAYRELLIRQRVNDAARAIMLAFARNGDLDQIGANFNVLRLTLAPGDPSAVPPVAKTMESDTDFRKRIQLALEGITTAGSRGSYIFHGLGAHPDVKDIQPTSPDPGEVLVYVLARSADGEPTQEVLDAVNAALNAENVRPLTDLVTVQAAQIIDYGIEAELVMYPGPDAEVVRSASQAAVTAYAESMRRLDYDVTLSGLYAALHQPGVQRVQLISPETDIVAGVGEATFASSITVTAAGDTDA